MMKNLQKKRCLPFKWYLTLLTSLFMLPQAWAQQSNLIPNKPTPLVSNSFSGLTVKSSETCFLGCVDEFNNKNRVIDSSLSNSSTWSYLIGGSAWIEVKDANATGTEAYPAGSIAGFIMDNNALEILGNTTISTYLGTSTTPQETKSGNDLLSWGLLSGKAEISMQTTKEFDRIRISFSALGVAGSKSVYYAFVKKFEAGPSLACNEHTKMAAPSFPAIIDYQKSGVSGIALGNISGYEHVIDGSNTTHATINMPVGITAHAALAVKNQITDYPAGTYVGFDLRSPSLVNIGVLNSVVIESYLNDTLKESKTGSSLFIGGGILQGSGRNIIGFVTSTEVDEVRLVINSGIAGVNLGTTEIYSAVFKKFCEGDSLVCNTPKLLTSPDYPLYVDGENTGIDGTGSVGSINNWEYAIDSLPNTVATITQTIGIFSTASFTIGDALTTYPANTYAGINISTSDLLTATVISYYKLEFLKDGQVVQTSTPSSLLVNVNSSILTGTSRSTIGMVSNDSFDAVKLIIEKPIGIDIGVVNIHGPIFEKLCVTPLVCGFEGLLQYGSHPVIINSARTGVLGVATVGADVINPDNVLDPDNTKFAEINNAASVASSSSISVLNPLQTYPVGTFAGYAVQNANGIIDLTVLGGVTIKTFNNGVLQESKTASSLLTLDALIPIFGPGTQIRNVGFVTTKEFDEIQIVVGELAGVLQDINVYGAYINTENSVGGGLLCSSTNPDFNVTYINVPVSGNVSTNDNMAAGTNYGTPTATTGNPSTVIPTINPDGTYIFTPDQPGAYVFDVPVCLDGQTTGCATELLKITVLDPNSPAINDPIANNDNGITKGDASTPTPLTINVKGNDGVGNDGGTLSNPTIVTGSSNGSEIVNPNGTVTYTPNAGFYGVDEFTYQVCETPSGLCETAVVTVNVLAPDAVNSTFANDDYASTVEGTPLTVNAANGVLVNDTDPEGNNQTVTAQNTTIPGKGNLALNTDGSYVFTPVAGFFGPIDFIYEVTDNGTPSASSRATLHILVEAFTTNPDFAVTYVNVPVPGNVSTNDNTPEGTTYGTPTATTGNPSTLVPTINPDGTYTFTPDQPGVYVFDVPVCLNGQTTGCATELLKITVIDPSSPAINDPIANNDNGITKGDASTPTPIIINVKGNDGVGNDGGTLSNPTIVTGSSNGNEIVNPNGTVTYTPNAGFYGVDEFTYQVCETPSGLCETAVVTVIVLAPDAVNSTFANDDYTSTVEGTPLTVNAANGVLVNDTDPEGNNQTVTAQNTIIPGKGSLALNTDGSYVFTPVAGFFGPVEFIYEVTDNGTPTASSRATLHILVEENISTPDLTISTRSRFVNFSIANNTISNFILDVFEINGADVQNTPATPVNVILFKSNSNFEYTFDPNQTSMNMPMPTNINNTNWELVTNNASMMVFKLKDGVPFNGYGFSSIGINIQVKSSASFGSLIINSIIPSNSGGETNDDNNSDVKLVNIQ